MNMGTSGENVLSPESTALPNGAIVQTKQIVWGDDSASPQTITYWNWFLQAWEQDWKEEQQQSDLSPSSASRPRVWQLKGKLREKKKTSVFLQCIWDKQKHIHS